MEHGIGSKFRDLADRNEVVDLLALVFEVEAGVSEGVW
jgi:hypothetical protein